MTSEEILTKKWYIVTTQSGCEGTAKTAIEDKIRKQKLEKWFGQILIPSENVVQMVKGQKQTRTKKFFPT